MLRSLAKSGVASALHWTGADRLTGYLAGLKNLPVVIGYHRVVEDIASHAANSIPANLITRQMLERHLDWLARRYRFLSLDELGVRLESGELFDKPVAAITFDDGYADVYHHAFPLLKRKGIPAGIFVVTDLIGTDRLQTYDKLYLLLTRAFPSWGSAPHALARLLFNLGLRRPNRYTLRTVAQGPFMAMRVLWTALAQAEIDRVIDALEKEVKIEDSAMKELHSLSWEMVLEMHRAGMTIGSHTRTHAVLPNESWEGVLDETATSRQVLERRLGTSVIHFAYPDGRFNAATVRSVADAGYRFAYTTCLHRNPVYPLLTIPRTLLWENSCLDTFGHFSPSIMSCQAHRVFETFAPCDQHHDWTSEGPRKHNAGSRQA